MIPYQIKQAAKQLLRETAIMKEDDDYYFEDGEHVQKFGEHLFDCTCSAHQYGERVCKHIYAAFLKEEEFKHDKKKQSLKARILEQESETLLSLFKTNSEQSFEEEISTSRELLHVQFIVKIFPENQMNRLSLEIKVGPERVYVVKQIGSFFNAIKEGRILEFTSHFTYDPADYDFDPDDWTVLKQLIRIYEASRLYDSELDSFARNYREDKRLLIPPNEARMLLEQISDRTSIFQIVTERNDVAIQYPKFKVTDENLDFSYRFAEIDKGDYQIEFESLQQAVFLDLYRAIFLDGTLHFLNEKNWEALAPLKEFQLIAKSDIIQFPEKKLGEMVSYVLPILQKSGHVEIDEDIETRIEREELIAELYITPFEVDKHQLQLIYRYGDQSFDPFQTEELKAQGRQVILRDIKKENYIMRLIENSPILFSADRMVLQANDEKLYQFYYRVIPKLKKFVTIHMAEELEDMIQKQVEAVTSFDLAKDNGLLSISFDFEGIPEDEIQDVLTSLKEKKTFHRLKNGRFISLEDRVYREMGRMIEFLDLRKNALKSTIQVPVYRGIQLYETFSKDQKLHSQFSKSYHELLEMIQHEKEANFDLPKELNASLRDYQVTGFNWMKSLSKYRLGGILADDMGLGKTIQTISYLLSELEENKQLDPILIVTPASLLYNWLNEFDNFAPKVEVSIIQGNKEKREKQIEHIEANQVYLISYPTLRQDQDLFQEKQFHTVILDESQNIKNYNTKASQAVRSVRARTHFALSGTPLENSTDELWAIFQTIMPGFFPSLRKFKELKHERVAELIRPFLLRRLKRDVVKELPEKIETNLYSELTTEQKSLYLAYLERIQHDLARSSLTSGAERIKLLAGLTRLRQICCDPRMFDASYIGESSKLNQLMDTVRAAKENGQRILIFSQFTSMLQLIGKELQKEELDFFYLDGKTSSKSRVQMADAFNQGEKDLFLISLKAGGTGLNLTGADTVILFDLWWNPAIEEQAASRAHRIGQKRVVQVIRMITKGTIEEKIYDLQKTKQALVDQLIKPGEQFLHQLSTDEIKAILDMNEEGLG
ncbi:helicase SNF2 [Listeria kieliensis]|uniref:Helicase SNF2 n=2 Tax=Listeria kieliensis TaxID=1621700 RepID=A0A3D8TVL4_9LIST|nr:DEAD/DEAH box helicase [Listeria kieliensis]RDX03050.1 helicase SNF2 [Listeria kieliensis]